mmetsp:Transcript_34989/g.90641  ORF Transcript_34989/g.90641 Transcript_34989/m.90641 type:complete len:285 (-) Transcript_34989:356-1210(-)
MTPAENTLVCTCKRGGHLHALKGGDTVKGVLVAPAPPSKHGFRPPTKLHTGVTTNDLVPLLGEIFPQALRYHLLRLSTPIFSLQAEIFQVIQIIITLLGTLVITLFGIFNHHLLLLFCLKLSYLHPPTPSIATRIGGLCTCHFLESCSLQHGQKGLLPHSEALSQLCLVVFTSRVHALCAQHGHTLVNIPPKHIVVSSVVFVSETDHSEAQASQLGLCVSGVFQVVEKCLGSGRRGATSICSYDEYAHSVLPGKRFHRHAILVELLQRKYSSWGDLASRVNVFA